MQWPDILFLSLDLSITGQSAVEAVEQAKLWALTTADSEDMEDDLGTFAMAVTVRINTD